MSKYIDADCLRVEIVRLKKEKPFHDDSSFLAYLHGLSKIEDFIDSLQQEQPELPKIEIAEYYYQKGVCEGFSKGSAESLKILDDFTKRKADPVIVVKHQEQPEVDLKQEIDRFLSNATMMNKGEWKGKYPISKMGFGMVARHFYNLGLNARKEN